MPIAIDSSRPYLSPSDLEDLVRAVMGADPRNESTWIEWKSRLDLEEKSAHHHIAKHVLGFANRAVEIARAHAGGYAYLIIGADPEGLLGISPVDPAIFQPWIVRYVGSAVRWRSEYLPVQNKQVLVVIVEPPRAGDPIYPLRRQFQTAHLKSTHHPGQIFVRRAGATAPANDFEIDQLNDRVRGNDGLDIDVSPLVENIEQRPSVPDIKQLVAAEREVTLARPRYGERTPGLPGFQLQAFRFTSVLDVKDDRSEEDYEKQVNRYIERYEHALQSRTTWFTANHRPTSLRLHVINRTDINFADVKLEVHVPGDVLPWPEESAPHLDLPELPARPDVLGTPQKRHQNFPRLAPVSPPQSYAPRQGRQTFTVRETGSVTITFKQFDLRPQESLPLDPVQLLVNATVGSVLNCTWKATARNARGQRGGGFDLTVAATTLHFEDLETRDPSDN